MRQIAVWAWRSVLGGFSLAVLAYALFCAWYLAETPTVTTRTALAARVALVGIVSALAFVWSVTSTRRARIGAASWLAWAMVSCACMTLVFVGYLYPIFFLGSVTNDRHVLDATVAGINAVGGATDIPLPQGYTAVMERRLLAPGHTRVDIHLSNRLVARVVGVDLIKVDNVAVEMRDGRIARAWVDYF